MGFVVDRKSTLHPMLQIDRKLNRSVRKIEQGADGLLVDDHLTDDGRAAHQHPVVEVLVHFEGVLQLPGVAAAPLGAPVRVLRAFGVAGAAEHALLGHGVQVGAPVVDGAGLGDELVLWDRLQGACLPVQQLGRGQGAAESGLRHGLAVEIGYRLLFRQRGPYRRLAFEPALLVPEGEKINYFVWNIRVLAFEGHLDNTVGPQCNIHVYDAFHNSLKQVIKHKRVLGALGGIEAILNLKLHPEFLQRVFDPAGPVDVQAVALGVSHLAGEDQRIEAAGKLQHSAADLHYKWGTIPYILVNQCLTLLCFASLSADSALPWGLHSMKSMSVATASCRCSARDSLTKQFSKVARQWAGASAM